MGDLENLLAKQRVAFSRDMNPDFECRRERLDKIEAMTERRRADIAAAISADFGHRARQETELAEIMPVIGAVRHARRHLKKWMKPRRAPTALIYRPGHNLLLRQPVGVVGVIAPWNYPYQLALAPAVAALAAGNRVMIKPSELTPRLAQLMADMIAEDFAPEEMTVVTGDADVGRAFSSLPFDHLIFTGSTAVGRQVAQAAGRNLTPVTLELGGKSPAILHEDCDLKRAAHAIAFGKWLNAGQTCIAPDYLLAPRARIDAVVAALKAVVKDFYPTVFDNPDYTSIVSVRHFERLKALVDEAAQAGAKPIQLVGEGETSPPESRKIAPMLLLGATAEMKIMQEEIFGPILPILAYDELDEALAFVNRADRPLALYAFGDDAQFRARVLNGTISGGVTLDDCLLHFSQEDQPFGGVGPSGIGAYHGEWGFRSFSKEKPVFAQSRLSGIAMLYPPFGKTFDRLAGMMKRLL